MTRPMGLVFDPLSGDTILIGEKSNASNLFLDDFVSALRSVYLFGEYPKVTIDPGGNNPKAKWHYVKMTEWIKDSHFGEVFFESDYLVKKIAFNLIRVRISGFKTQYRLMTEKRRKNNICSRFWLNPLPVEIPVSENVVFVNTYPIQLSTETLYPAYLKDDTAVKFAQSFSKRYDEFSEEFPVFEDLRNLQRLVGIVSRTSAMAFSPDFRFWLRDYEIKKVKIPEKVRGLSNIYGDLDSISELHGGVDSTFLNLRLRAEDPTAFTDLANLVINSRPSKDALTWNFPLQEFKLSLPPLQLKVDVSEIERFFSDGTLSFLKKDYEKAIENFTKVIELIPDYAQVYLLRAGCYGLKGDYDKVITDCQKVIEIIPKSFMAYSGLGLAYYGKKVYDQAIFNFDKALQINPNLSIVWYEKGNLLNDLEKYQEALICYNEALKINAEDRDVLVNKSDTLLKLKRYEEAFQCAEEALKIKSEDYMAWFNKGEALENLKKTKEAIEAYEMFIKFAPTDDPDIGKIKDTIRRLKGEG